MIFKELGIKDVWQIESEIHEDNRGSFRRSYCEKEFKKNGILADVSQGNISENPAKGTLRGFHYQTGNYKEAKTITCLTGSIFDVVIDLRKGSNTFLKYIIIEISASDKRSLHIPKGCANAWMTLESNTIIHYYMSNPYKPGFDRGIRYDDKLFNIEWPFKPCLISKKDLSYKNFSEELLN